MVLDKHHEIRFATTFPFEFAYFRIAVDVNGSRMRKGISIEKICLGHCRIGLVILP